MRLLLVLLLLVLAAAPGATALGLPLPLSLPRLSAKDPPANFTYETFMLPSDNGTLLNTWVFTHVRYAHGPMAVMYEQTPYSDPDLLAGLVQFWTWYVEYGNVTVRLVLQNYRGTGNSTGTFDGLASVSRDAQVTLEWLQGQPWCNGVVYRFGSSAMGMAAYLQAQLPQSPGTRAGFYWVATDDLYPVMFPQGAYRYELAYAILAYIGRQEYRPVFEAHEAPSTWWDRSRVVNYSTVAWPAIHMLGWCDPFLKQQLKAAAGYQQSSAPAVRGSDLIIIPPQGHCSEPIPGPWAQQAQLLFVEGLVAGMYLFEIFNASVTPLQFAAALQLWRLYTAKVPKVIWFVIGPPYPFNDTGNFITGGDALPTPALTGYYVLPGGQLGTTPHPSEFESPIVHDPANPVPTLGGATLNVVVPGFNAPCGMWDQLLIGNRSDILQFTSAPLAQPLLITGEVSAVLHVSSNVSDADFMAKLVDVFPNGTRLLIADGALRMRWRDRDASPVPKNMTVGTVYRVAVDLWTTAFMFPAGHRIGLDLLCSNYPKYSVNPGTGWGLADEASGPRLVARNTVFAGGIYDTQLVLPVIRNPDELPRLTSPIFPQRP